MEDTQDPVSLTYTGAPAGGDRDSNKSPEASKAHEKSGEKKKQRKKKHSAKGKDQTLTEETGYHQCVNCQHTQSRTTCDQSTQTETESTQTQATQSPLLQCTHTQPTESKSTQTSLSKLTLKQVYEGQGSKDQSGEDQASSADQLTVLTWNIDGLDCEDLKERIPSLLEYLGKYHADVVLLQELIPPYLKLLQDVMKDYEFLEGSDSGYFTAILLRRSRVELLESNIVKYPTTEMTRNLLMATAKFSGHQLCFMTSHMESLKVSSQERLNQLRRVWKRMKEAADGQTVIFGGDTNLRDWEVKKLGGLPDGILDVWEMLGEPEDCRYTWDTVTNNNKEIPFPARLRFDRVYLRTAREGPQLHPDSMTLVGLEKLKCGRFTSDHWGILCTFSFQS
ncbi:tyrosyl-DNA phosphodiesterase 2 [Colossoma macropomum]|uniref:tyrosyl-DNA phosphodiesterase 2 n=1 Tax=Colossoma macropomum TaxID=42526 RepID=UPI001864043E|nr:tyrosyl-DNA phosphodiesterase 2 [Colossoma macropomum]XP_036416476.1 tyrosyl-DNA phosphodiesterase 2 [Colossoma macropomum]